MRLVRQQVNGSAIIGELRLGMQIMAVTLEDPPKEGKGPIPMGIYRVKLTYSQRFQCLLPEVLGVPGFTGIRLHAGNTKADTEGCILVGTYQSGPGEIAESRAALGALLMRWPEWHDTMLEITAVA